MQKIDLLVTNARIMQPAQKSITPQGTAFAVDKGVVLEVGDGTALAARYSPAKTLDAAGKYVVPGFVNTHNHLFQVLTKGLGKGLLLWDWLNTTIFAMRNHMDEEAVYHAALAGCLASMRTGVTTTLDFNYLNTYPAHFDAVCQAFTDSGMRGYVGRNQYIQDDNGPGLTTPETLDEYLQHLESIAAGMQDPAMLNVAIVVPIIINMLELPQYCPGYLRRLRESAERLLIPYTAHLVETVDDDNYCTKRTGHSTIQFMEREEFFGERCVLAHCVYMDECDYAIFKRRNVKVSYNPISNMILASGIAPIQRFLEEGVSVSIATDGPGSNDSLDMLESIKAASLLQKVACLDSRVLPAEKVLELATLGGADALCRSDLGSIEAGKRADFFLYNPSQLRSAPVADAMSSLVYASGERCVDTVVINGRVLLQGDRFAHVDEAAVVRNLEESARRVRRKSGIDA